MSLLLDDVAFIYNIQVQMNGEIEDVPGIAVSRPPDVPAFHLIFWLFAVTFPLDKEQSRRAKALYGNSNETIHPVTPSIQAFDKVMKRINKKNKKCVVKVVVDEKLSEYIIESSKKDNKIIQIYFFIPEEVIAPIFLPNQIRTYSTIIGNKKVESFQLQIQDEINEEINFPNVQSEILPRNNKMAGVFRDFNSAIKRAEREVQNFTKSFRTFENSHCLIDQFEKINRYRFRLISFINIKISSFEQSFQDFKDFYYRVQPWLKRHIEGMGKQCPSGFSSLNSYEVTAQKIKGLESKTLQPAALEDQRLELYHKILSIYQEEGLFYHLLNSNLKVVGQQEANWKDLALPFSHLYRSIKCLYKQGLTENPSFYSQPFVVYRGGRARKSELNKYREHAGNIFIQFFGFLSTSLSAKIVADRFVSFHNSRDSQGDSTDQSVIFRIVVNPNTRILEEKYNFLINGFFKMTSKQTRGQKELQILFNALNVFKLMRIKQEPIINYFTQIELEEVEKKKNSIRNTKQYKYLQENKKIESYQSKITIVDLEFGSFYDALLTDNIYDLSQNERAAKENYIWCINKVLKFDKFQNFDFGDALELTSKLDETYAYLKSKVGSKEDNLYDISQKDGKNYFQRLSTVCRKLGKVNEGICFSRIAIECYKQLQSVHLNQTFNQHYQKLFDMQLRCIEMLRETSNFKPAQKQLKKQLNQLRSKNFKGPKVKLRESQIYINQAINYYSMGKLEECFNRFDKCRYQLKKTIQAFSFEDEEITCCVSDFFIQLFCKSPEIPERSFLYSTYIANLKKYKRQKRQRDLIRQHGDKKELESTSELANDLLKIASDALQNRKKMFKSRKNYTQFIDKFSKQIEKKEIIINQQSSQKQKLVENIRQAIFKLSSIEQDSQQYKQMTEKFNKLIKQYNEFEMRNLSTEINESCVQDMIAKFKLKERQRKIRTLNEQKVNILTQNKHQLVEKYIRCTNEIENVISELKKQGFLDTSIAIIKMRVEKSKIYQECEERDSAMKEIEEIIRIGLVEGEDRNNQLAYAFSTQGKIYLDMMQVEAAIQSFNKALIYFRSTINDEDEYSQLDVSNVTENQVLSSQMMVHPEQPRANQLHQNNNYLETRIMRAKAILIWIETKKESQNGVSRNIYDDSRQVKDWRLWHSDDHMIAILSDIKEIKRILQIRDELEDVQGLKTDILQVQAYYFLNCTLTDLNLQHAFQYFGQCLSLRNNQLGEINLKNIEMCCNLVSRHHKNQKILSHFLQLGHIMYLKMAHVDYRNYALAWKVEKALYYLTCMQESKDSQVAKMHLERAIEILQLELSKKHQKYLETELSNLKLKLTQRERANMYEENVNMQESNNGLNELDDFNLQMSTVVSKMRKRRPIQLLRYQSRRDSMSTRGNFDSNRQSTMRTIKIKPSNNLQPQTGKSFTTPLNYYCRNIQKIYRDDDDQ